jgi:glycosyltransferase involved in cell wall biosynthesis
LIGLLRENPYPVNLIHVNALGLPGFVGTHRPEFFRGKYNIGYWLWELPELPEAYHGAFSYLDEVWVSSDYGLETVARVSPIPVVKVPPPLPAEGLPTLDVGRAHFGLQDGQCVFLFMFDAHSVVERKNPGAVIRAFKRAFQDEPDARLVLKVAHGDRALVEGLAGEADDARVLVMDRVFERAEVNSLLALCDCYVSLHRSEGFGLTMAEAMALGKPVIATGHSANLDFMNVANSLLVRFDMVRLEQDYPPYPRGSLWADPDLAHAAELMRVVFDDRDRARKLGERGRADVMAYLSPERVGARITERLALIGRDLEARGSIYGI